MSQKIIRAVLEKPSSANWTIAELGTALATELGINFNTENNVLYMGTDDNSGIELAQSTSSATAITMYPYYGGIRLTNHTMGIWDGSALSYNNILFLCKNR